MAIRSKKQSHFYAHPLPSQKNSSSPPFKKNSLLPPKSQRTKIEVLENIAKSEHKKIASRIKSSLSERDKKRNIDLWNAEVAPQGKIMIDAISTINRKAMPLIDNKMKETFSLMAVEGHASEAHATFKEHYPNTTQEHVLDAISQADPAEIRSYYIQKSKRLPKDQIRRMKRDHTKIKFQNRCQSYVDTEVTFLEDWFKEMERNLSDLDPRDHSIAFRNTKAQTLNKASYLKGMEVYMLGRARRFYLTSQMDTSNQREKAEKKYGYTIGKGEGYLTNMKKLQEFGLDIKDLSSINYKGALKPLSKLPHNTRLGVLEELGIIKRKGLPLEDIANGEYTWEKIKGHPAVTNLQKTPGYQEKYIREERGYGIGDDIVIFNGVALSNSIYSPGFCLPSTDKESGLLGGLSGDFIDTVTKGSKYFFPGGADYIAGLHINGLHKRLAQDKRYRKAFGIKNRADGNYNLIDDNELTDFIMSGANLPIEGLHSSQRHFWMDHQGMCMVSELMKHTYFHAMANGENMHFDNLKNFKINLTSNRGGIKFTHQGIPLREVKQTLNNRLYLISDPNKREERIRQYFTPN